MRTSICLLRLRGARWLLLCAVFVVAGGCGAKVKVIGLRTDPSFTYDSLSAGGIVVGGVTFCHDELETAERLLGIGSEFKFRVHSASLLRASILEKRPDIDVQPAIAISWAVGLKSYTALLDDYELAGELEQARLAQLSEAFEEIRYVIFARIESDVIDRGTETTRDWDPDYGVTDEETTEYWITRTVTTGFQVYDLTAGTPVWSVHVKASKKKENAYGSGDWFLELIRGLMGEEQEYPSTPEFNKLLRKTFEGFAKHLPKR